MIILTETLQVRKKGGLWLTKFTATREVEQDYVKNIVNSIPYFKTFGGTEKLTKYSNGYPKKLVSTAQLGLNRTIREFAYNK